MLIKLLYNLKLAHLLWRAVVQERERGSENVVVIFFCFVCFTFVIDNIIKVQTLLITMYSSVE